MKRIYSLLIASLTILNLTAMQTKLSAGLLAKKPTKKSTSHPDGVEYVQTAKQPRQYTPKSTRRHGEHKDERV